MSSAHATLLQRLWPRFEDAAEEARFRSAHAARVGRQVALYAPMAIGFVLAAGAGHVLLFPRAVWLPVLVLLAVTMLLPLLHAWSLARRDVGHAQLQRAMRITATGAAIGVCLVVASARAQAFPLPYEGILLVTMTIFLISGLLARDAMLIALICLAGIVLIEWSWPTVWQEALVRSFFGLACWLLGSVFALSMERADRRDFRHRETLHAMALRDPLTGLLNRRGLDERFALLLATARRDRAPLSLAVIDLDHFKAYNDACGHDAGDAVLVAVANALQRHARRPLDAVARLGGEEFLLAWQGADAADGERLAGNVCSGIHALALAHPASPVAACITASIGVVSVAAVQESDTLDSLYRAADTALYEAKRCGRNRACTAAANSPGASA
jgi:diguanylate cyclase (GGDEF)-like protein